MSVNIGGFTPGFSFRLSPQEITSKIFSSTSSGISTGHILDTNIITNSITGAVTGKQFNIQVVPEQFVVYGQNPIINLISDNSGIATIDQFGNTNFIKSGNFNIIGNYDSNSFYQGKTVILPLTNLSGGGNSLFVANYIPDQVNISKHVLIVYNSGSINSTNLKTYYTGTRPQFTGANILNINCDTGQYTSYSSFINNIRNPIVNYLTGVLGSKPIRYIILMMEIPTNVADTNISSVSYQLSDSFNQLGLRNGNPYGNQYVNHFAVGQFSKTTALVSHINFSGYSDCTGYIKKISNGQTGIYLTGNGLNTGYYFEDVNELYHTISPNFISGRYIKSLSNESGNFKIFYSGYSGNFIHTGQNVAGFCSWMTNAGRSQQDPINGNISWGNNNWYIMTTIESFNGMAQPLAPQSTYLEWFSPNAFGGSNYSNVPVGAVGHTWEPGLGGVAYTGFFALWQRGWPFIECAWQSRVTPYFAAFGDPLLCK